ncbi:HAMP domain-containing histidine kinase [Psychrosphaera sp. B3R10]|uniref:sensor histidine kinase n=1 Tax=unclassified Psychrosphaera TaxID=2641570 RepID=UPI001C0A2159|nr:HAMP domain-containing histidine kinase [Psychrosphaera sp. I2R16]MBU2989213.1 HAMP domain-containing histidine kinase [Psychrosphaera sp. B3R10]
MNSIKKKLSRYLSISISILLVSILLATDISVDTWISSEFDRAMTNKASLLETLVEEDEQEVDFDFAGEFMPEFEGKENPEYYQLWHKNKVFEKSDTLELFEVNELPRLTVNLGGSKFKNITLPDGRQGRMIFTKFLPQIDSELRKKLGVTRAEFAKTQQPMEFAYALSTEELDYILWYVDIIFILVSLLAVFTIKKIVSVVVDKSLKPIDNFNSQLGEINLNSEQIKVPTDQLPEELLPTASAVNQFIMETHELYKREKRVTSDIAHELKTPIAELLSLSEVAIKFPHEEQITSQLASDVQQISNRLKNIVNGILLLQKSSTTTALEKSDINLVQLIENTLKRENLNNREISFIKNQNGYTVKTNKVALDTILSNLINNAFYYSPDNSPVTVDISEDKDNTVVQISNLCTNGCNEEDLNRFFEPLWQQDSSRTSTQRYGLGLAIVKSYCERLGASISVSLGPDKQITFTLVI